EDALGRAGELVVELVRAIRRHHRDRALVGPEPTLDVEREPRTLRLVLGDDVGELPGVAEGAAVEGPRTGAADVPHHEPDGATDGEVGAPAGTEEVVAGVDVDGAGDRAVDEDEDRGPGRGRSRPMVAPPRIADGLDRRHHDRHVLRTTAGQDGVDGDLL